MATPSIILYGFPGKDPSTPSSSGFCQKLETFLRAVNFTSYTHASTFPPSAPKQKLPYIILTPQAASTPGASPPKSVTLADSHFIARYLVRTGIVPDLDAQLTAVQRADSRAWQSWTEELVYSAIVHTRWSRPANYEACKRTMPGPSITRPIIGWFFRRRILNSLWASGIGRHSDAEIEILIEEWVQALEARLGASSTAYFHGGGEPTMVDVVLYAFLANALTLWESNPEVSAMLLRRERLRQYVALLTRRWFPEYEALLRAVEDQ